MWSVTELAYCDMKQWYVVARRQAKFGVIGSVARKTGLEESLKWVRIGHSDGTETG